MGIWRQTTGLLLLVMAAGMLTALRPAAAQEPPYGTRPLEDQVGQPTGLRPANAPESPFSQPDAVALPSWPWLGPRISEARWYAAADALMLMRDSTPSRPMATLGPSGDIALHTKDLESSFQAGPRVTLGRRLGERHQIEFTWFDLSVWSDRAAVRNESANDLGGFGNLFSPFTDFGAPAVVFLDYNYLAQIEYRSELDNWELNLRHSLPMPPGPLAVSLLVGGRHLRIHERFGYHAESYTPLTQASFNTVDVRAGNELWGVQLGALFEFQVTYRSRITLDLKGGIFNNNADQSTICIHSDPITGTNTYTGSRAENVTAWAGEIALGLTYQITPRLTSQAGYQMLWVEGIALGSENFEDSAGVLVGGPANLRHDGHAVYHGPYIGLEFRL